jgi:hypothetical protein
MNFATKTNRTRIFVWFMWFTALLVFSQPAAVDVGNDGNNAPLLGAVSHDPQNGPPLIFGSFY